MATGSLDANGIWIYGEDDSEATFSALLNKLADSTSDQIAPLQQAGRLVQVVTASDSTKRTTTSTSYISASLSASITPKKSGNLIIALWSFRANVSGNDADGFGFFRITQGGVGISGAQEGTIRVRRGAITPGELTSSLSLFGVFTAPSLSAITFTAEYRNGFSGVTTNIENELNTGRLFLLEVAS